MNRNGYRVGLIEFAATIVADYASHSSSPCLRLVPDRFRDSYRGTIPAIARATEPTNSRTAAATNTFRRAPDPSSTADDEKARRTDQQAGANENQ